MRAINKIILHFSETPEGMYFDAADIRRWHVEDRGWKDIGYHYVIQLDGTIEQGRSLEVVGAHCFGHNRDSIGICYIGGKFKDGTLGDTRTAKQMESLELLIQSLRVVFSDSHLMVFGHNDFDNKKVCPGFDAKQEYN
jgi:N-acetylmuramoyl-L-alanine amidase